MDFEKIKKFIESQTKAGKPQHNLLTDYINNSDLDIRIATKKLARKLGYAILPAKSGKYTVLPTKGMYKFYN